MENQIELRSEKVRNIIGKPPHILIRIGSGLFFMLLTGLVLGSLYFPYQPNYSTTGYLHNDSAHYVVAKVPVDFVNDIDISSAVSVSFKKDSKICPAQFPATISAISEIVIFENESSYQELHILLKDKLEDSCWQPIQLNGKVKVNVIIQGRRRSVFSLVLKYFFKA